MLVSILHDAFDAPEGLADFYRSPRPPHLNFVLKTNNTIAGVVTGTVGSDYRGHRSFAKLELPPAPHAFLTRIYVIPEARGGSAGLDLLEAFASEAHSSRCTYMVGILDHASDSRARDRFFAKTGFISTPDGMLGVGIEDLLSTIRNLPR